MLFFIFSVVRQVDGTLVKRYKHPGPVYGCDWSLNNRYYKRKRKKKLLLMWLNVIKARLNFEPMQSAVSSLSVHDLRGDCRGLCLSCKLRCISCWHFELIFADLSPITNLCKFWLICGSHLRGCHGYLLVMPEAFRLPSSVPKLIYW